MLARITGGAVVDGDDAAGLGAVDRKAEDVLGIRAEADLHARLGGGVVGEEKQQAAIKGTGLGCALSATGERACVLGNVHAKALRVQ